MQCPVCHSDNVQKLSVAYEQGTQNIQTQSRTFGSGVGMGGGSLGAGFGSASTTTKGTSQSITAKKAAPPDKKSLVLPAGVAAGGAVAILAFSYYPIGIAMIAIGAFILWRHQQYNSKVYPPLYDQWQHSWLCHKCGNIYVQPLS